MPQAALAALPDNSGGGNTSGGYGQNWDGIDFEDMIGDGIYYGTYDHVTALTYGYGYSNPSAETGLSREGEKTPILWRIMGEDSGDGQLTMMSEYVIDGKKFSHRNAGTDQGVSNFANSYLRTWLNVFTNTGYGGITNGFLYSFGDDSNTAEYKGLAITSVSTKLFDRYTGEEYISGVKMPQDWSSGLYYTPAFPYSQGTLAYIPWGHFGGYPNPSIGPTNPYYGMSFPHADSGKLYWDAYQEGNDDYLIGTANTNEIIAATKDGADVYYWTRTGNAYNNTQLSWSNDMHSIYPFYVSTTNTSSIITTYDANYVLGVRPIVKLKPENVIFAHEIAETVVNPSQIQSDKGVSGIWNYSTNDGSGTNYKLTILNSSLSLNELYKGSFSLTSGEDLHLDAGDSITLNSSDFNGEYLAYKIVYDDGTTRSVVSYGNNKAEADNETLVIKAANNIANINNFIDSGDYTLYVWTQDETSDIRSFEGSSTWYFPLGVSGASDLINPEVISVNPEGIGIAVSTNKLSVTFSEEMNASAGFPGTVTLDNANISLTNGFWSNSNQTITYDLSGLNYSTTYTYEIKDFEDAAGNLMITPVPDFTFRTVDPGKTGGGSGGGTVIDDENNSTPMGGEDSQMGGTEDDQMGGYEEDIQPVLVILLFMIAVAVFAYRRCEEEKDAQDETFLGWFRPF